MLDQSRIRPATSRCGPDLRLEYQFDGRPEIADGEFGLPMLTCVLRLQSDEPRRTHQLVGAAS